MKYLIFILISVGLLSCASNKQTYSKEVEQKIEKPINKIIQDSEPSFDNNEQNSGIIDFIPEKGWIITQNAANRYNILIKKYGQELSPPISENFGLSKGDDNFFILNQQGMINFALLNQKHKSQIK